MAVATHCDGRHTNGENLQARPSTHVETFTPRLGSISTARIDLRDGWTLDAIGPQGRPWMWDDDYDVLENGGVVGRIFKVPVAPPDRPWMWASGRLEPSGFGSLVALRTAAPSECISRADRPQDALTEPVGIALTGFRKCDDALRKRRKNGVVPVGGGAERRQRHLKGNPHLTDRFAVELMTVEVGPDGHRKRQKAASDCAIL
jgi:hypothetical protein